MTLTQEQESYIIEIYHRLNERLGQPPTALKIAERFESKYCFSISNPSIIKRLRDRDLELAAKGGYRGVSRRHNAVKVK